MTMSTSFVWVQSAIVDDRGANRGAGVAGMGKWGTEASEETVKV